MVVSSSFYPGIMAVRSDSSLVSALYSVRRFGASQDTVEAETSLLSMCAATARLRDNVADVVDGEVLCRLSGATDSSIAHVWHSFFFSPLWWRTRGTVVVGGIAVLWGAASFSRLVALHGVPTHVTGVATYGT